MHSVFATVFDAVAMGCLAFIGFKLGDALARCAPASNCPQLTPLVIAFVVVGLVLYVGLSALLLHSTPGQRLFHVGLESGENKQK